MGAMLGVVLVDNVMVLYMFWELTSLSSFLLIGYWYKREKSRYGAAKSLLITVSGGLCMLGGFILLYLITDSFSIREMILQVQLIAGHDLFIPAMILILLGAFTKSAQFLFISGCLMRWKLRHQSALISIQLLWSKPVFM